MPANGANSTPKPIKIREFGWNQQCVAEPIEKLPVNASVQMNPVENIWQYLRANWLSNRVFENYSAIIDAGCEAWNKLIAQLETITSIGMRKWAHIGQY